MVELAGRSMLTENDIAKTIQTLAQTPYPVHCFRHPALHTLMLARLQTKYGDNIILPMDTSHGQMDGAVQAS